MAPLESWSLSNMSIYSHRPLVRGERRARSLRQNNSTGKRWYDFTSNEVIMNAYSPFARLILFLAVQSAVAATVIHVPAGQPTIQAGIDVATDGDTVLVAPGTYTENINFHGKNIKVESSNGSKGTIINGNQAGPVVTFSSGENSGAVLSGFTITNGRGDNASGYSGGGIYCQNSSPTIRNNVITANVAAIGGGIEVLGGAPRIVSNKITNNRPDPNISGGWGGGIALENGASSTVIGNQISDNLWNSNAGLGGGVALNNAGSPFLENNVIFFNQANFGPGGGIWSVNSTPLIIQNLFVANTAQFGGGVYLDSQSTTSSAIFVNNTFAENVGNGVGLPGDGSAVYVVGYDDQVEFFNNIFASSAGRESFFCGPAGVLPELMNNDGFDSSGNGFGGDCANAAGTNGNISADPQFVAPSLRSFQLKPASPAINAGDSAAPELPLKDLRGKPRIVGQAIDMGVYEFQ